VAAVVMAVVVVVEAMMAGWKEGWGRPNGVGVIISRATWWSSVELNLGWNNVGLVTRSGDGPLMVEDWRLAWKKLAEPVCQTTMRS
jgi:hypothetical protein